MATAKEIIDAMSLSPHPEGGWYRETFRAAPLDGNEAQQARASCTCILYLLQKGERSHWHRVTDADEIWMYHAGAPLRLSVFDTIAEEFVLGPLQGETASASVLQAFVPKGAWQAAESLGEWSLVGCVVAPGFEFSGFEMAPPDFDPATLGNT